MNIQFDVSSLVMSLLGSSGLTAVLMKIFDSTLRDRVLTLEQQYKNCMKVEASLEKLTDRLNEYLKE